MVMVMVVVMVMVMAMVMVITEVRMAYATIRSPGWGSVTSVTFVTSLLH